MTKNSAYKAVLSELAETNANYPLYKDDTEKKTAESLLLKAEVGTSRKK